MARSPGRTARTSTRGSSPSWCGRSARQPSASSTQDTTPTTVASAARHVGHQGAQPPARLVVQGGQQGADVEVGDRVPLAVDDAAGVLGDQHREEVGTPGADGLGGAAGQVEGQVDARREGRGPGGGVLGDDGDASQLGGPLRRVEPRQLEDDAVDGGQGRDRAVGLPVPGLGLHVVDAEVEVERDVGGGEQADGARQAGVDGVAVEESAAGQGVDRVVQRPHRVEVGGVLDRGSALAHPVLQRARPWLGHVEGQRSVAGEPRDGAQLREREPDPAGEPVEEALGLAGRGGEVDGRHQALLSLSGPCSVRSHHSPGRFTVSQSLWPGLGGEKAASVSSASLGLTRTRRPGPTTPRPRVGRRGCARRRRATRPAAPPPRSTP